MGEHTSNDDCSTDKCVSERPSEQSEASLPRLYEPIPYRQQVRLQALDIASREAVVRTYSRIEEIKAGERIIYGRNGVPATRTVSEKTTVEIAKEMVEFIEEKNV